MEESNLILFFGRFHPLIVHLPIGFLILAVIFEVTERLRLTRGLVVAVPFTLLIGTLSAIGATVIGFMLASSGDYDGDNLNAHKWAGIITTVISGLAYLLSAGHLKLKEAKDKIYLSSLGIIVIGLSITGHAGGNMTHGSDYLTAYMPFKPEAVDPLARPKVTHIAEAQVFGDLVHPIIEAKCKSCHNEDKKKGQLSFASIEDYLKGGKHGHLIVAGSANESELFERVTLDSHDKEFMPPEGKTPLTEDEILILKFWIEEAQSSYDTLLKDVEASEEVMLASNKILGLDGHVFAETISLSAVDKNIVATLKEKGFEVRELVAESNAFDITLPAKKANNKTIDSYLKALEPLKENIVWLSLENNAITNKHLEIISRFKSLRKLKLCKNNIDDNGISHFSSLSDLESINLYGTKLTTKGIDILAKLPEIKRVYAWQTTIKEEDVEKLKEKYKELKIVAGY